MALQLRTNKKATAIAWKILGEPANIAYKRTEKQKRIDHRLLQEETTRVR